ncbi:hypothetical protein [Wolbachia endosymbiont (group A) of Urophora cardui]|uniref:hypothetical protein n=1 Tax=Wolbachia endosymbiont (group A) of Urophora cardui TaxID=3066156 RepID=UPI00334071EA
MPPKFEWDNDLVNSLSRADHILGMLSRGLCCIASYDGLKIKKMENISSLLFWYL